MKSGIFGKSSVGFAIVSLGAILLVFLGGGNLIDDKGSLQLIIRNTSIILAFLALVMAAIRLSIVGASLAVFTLSLNIVLLAIGIIVLIAIVLYFYSNT